MRLVPSPSQCGRVGNRVSVARGSMAGSKALPGPIMTHSPAPLGAHGDASGGLLPRARVATGTCHENAASLRLLQP